MAVMHMNYLSETIGMHQSFVVILPEDASYFDQTQSPKALPSLLLLHGLSSDATSYLRYTSIERYANEAQLAIIMPNADHSFYTNMAHGHRYYDYVLEVWDYVHQILPLSPDREDHFIAGHSMGGYGTIKYALTQGHRFAKAAPLSAVYDISRLINYDWYDFDFNNVVDTTNEAALRAIHPYHLVEEAVQQQAQLPDIYMMCGTEDDLYEDNVAFSQQLKKLDVKHDFVSGPGRHDYAYWDEAIQQVIKVFMK